MELSTARNGLFFGIEWIMNKCQKRIYIMKQNDAEVLGSLGKYGKVM